MSDSQENPNDPGAGGDGLSMEQILASIRRILKEEEGLEIPPDSEPEDEVLVLSPSMVAPVPEPAPAPAPIQFAVPAKPPEAAVPAPQSRPASQYDSKEDHLMVDDVQSPKGLVGEHASTEIANTIGSLVRSVSVERSVAVSRGGATIEDIVREEIKPVMKAWLDTHLPGLVERIVRAEIERVLARSQA